MAARTRMTKNVRQGKNWFYMTGDDLAQVFPYLSKSGVEKTIDRLHAKGCVEISNFNKLSFDKTRWFHVPQPYDDATEVKPIVFDTDIARAHGIPAAVLLNNYQYHAKKNGPDHKMTPAQLNYHLPFLSKPTIKRALKKLRGAKLIPQLKHDAVTPDTGTDLAKEDQKDSA